MPKDPIRVTTLTRIWIDLRRALSRNEWVVKLLRLDRSSKQPTDPGLILIQIDGLSRRELERAMESGRMPFLRSLLRKQHFENHSFYSGLPASTPAVQGELYYGKRTVVPAFGFRDHRSGHLVRMFSNDVACEVEQNLAKENTGLLQGGSSYCNNYDGGASESHFCATSFGWSEFWNTINPFKLLLVMLFNFWMFFRVFGLMVMEFFLATFDFIRGTLSGRRFWQELFMIPARVVVVVLLRELVTVGACYDAARGLPIIHLNLLGYDEQAHRRGPGSRFAHWTLRGIDKCIRRIWKSAHRGAGREYDLWVFSDHGQEATKPYQLAHGKLIQEVVAELVDGQSQKANRQKMEAPLSKPASQKKKTVGRADWLGVGWLVSVLFGEQDYDVQTRSVNVQTTTSGPLAFIYLLNPDAKQHTDEIANRLVNEFHVPMAVQAMDASSARVTTQEGSFVLPNDAVLVFGSDHPFLEDVTADLIELVNHPDAGEIVLAGWTHQDQSTSFVLQNGAHAGPGFDETGAFALLPSDAPIPDNKKRYLRPNDLRLAALSFLGHREKPLMSPPKHAEKSLPIQLLTYNVHACVGMDGQLSPARIARVIAQSGANVICLQELDVRRKRSGFRDQAEEIARHLEMEFEFHPAWHLEEEKFGNAILTRFPMRIIRKEGLHHHKSDRSRRSAIWAEIEIDSQTSMQVINTHLSIYPKEQLIQAKELSDDWIQPAIDQGPVIICGDFNARPNSATHRQFAESLVDVEAVKGQTARATYFSPFPFTRVDHIFVTPGIRTQNVKVIKTRLARTASDHLPLLATLELGSESETVDDPSRKGRFADPASQSAPGS